MATFTGTNGSNDINGTNAQDVIYGLGGDDELDGRGGNDTIYGGTGDDEIEGGSGDDSLYGEQGHDKIYGEDGDDFISGGNDRDAIYGGNGNDTLNGDAGEDYIDGGSGNDIINGGADTDLLSGGSGDDRITGGGGIDLINGGSGTDTAVYSGNFADYTIVRLGPLVKVIHNGPGGPGSGPDGADLLLWVERLQFADALVDLTQNNTPVANDDSASVTEDVGTYSSGSASVLDNDVDYDGDTLTVTPGTYVGTYGTLVLAADGTYTYTPNAAAQGLDTGETVTDSFTYTASDGAASDSATLTITIHGLNDAPVANDDGATTSEDAAVAGNVLANDTDVDGEPLTVANPGTYVGAYGTLVLAADGSYTYTPSAAAQELDDGETVTDSFAYTASDGTATDGATLTVSVTGLNDAPVANDDAASTDEDSAVSGNVLANDTDVDGETLTVANPGTYVGAYGTLVLAADGSYTYTPNAATQGLDDGETVTDSFAYVASDGTAADGATLTVSVAGLNDAPVANDDSATASEDAAVSGNVLANDTDVDGELLTVTNPGTYVGAYGTLVLGADGSYTYTPNAAAQGLDDGETVADSFAYTASDGTATDVATLTVSVTGLNDAPVANDDTATTDEDSAVSGNVLANDTDVDGEPLTVANPGTYVGAYGTLVLAADGSYTYTPSAAAQELDDGETVTDSFAYTASDGTATDGATLTVSVTGLNDAPVANDDAASTDEDSAVSGNVLANDTDVDGEGLTVANAGTYVGAYGTLVLAADGSYTYTPGAAADGLAVGEAAQDVFSYSASDGTTADGGTLTVTVTGTNDAPTIDAANTDASGSVTELPNDDPNEGTFLHQDSGTIAFDDLDLSDAHSATAAPQGGGYLGTFTLGPVNQGADTVGWNFEVSDAAIDSLDAGESIVQTYTISVSDGNGGTATQNVTITINGADDAPPLPDGVWFIDNAAVGSANLGTQDDPFTSIASFNAAQGTAGGPAAGDTIYLRQGTGTYAEADGINLLGSQTLIGGGEDLIIAGTTYETGTGRPTIVTTAGANHGVELATGNVVRGLDIGSTTGAGIADGNGTVGSLLIANVGKSGAGQIIDIDQGGTLNVTLNGAASTGSTGGAIDLNAVGGSFTVSGATIITGLHSGNGIDITSSSLTATFAGGGTIATGAARGVNFINNAGGNLVISGGNFDVTTTTGNAINVFNSGSVSIAGAGNNIVSGTGTAVFISGTASAGVTLESVASTGGTAPGILLNGIGGGGFTVTGIGSIGGSGGSITGKTGADGSTTAGIGVSIVNSGNVALNNMVVSGHSNYAIFGSNVAGFTLRDSTVGLVNGSNIGIGEGALRFDGLTGTALLEGNSIAGGVSDNLRIANSSGNLNLTVRDSASDQAVFGLNGNNGNDSVTVTTSGTASLTLLIDGVEFTGARDKMVEIVALGSSTQNITLSDNIFHNVHPNIASGGGGVLVSGGGVGSAITVDYVITGNSIRGAEGSALSALYAQQSGNVRGYIADNVIGIGNGIEGGQGSSDGGSGIDVALDKTAGAGNATHSVSIIGNEVYDIASGIAGITLRSSGGTAANGARLEAVVNDNIVEEMGNGALFAFYALVGGTGAGDFARLGLEMNNNRFDASGADFGLNAAYFDQVSNNARFYLPGYGGSANGEFVAPPGTASDDLDAFLTAKGNVFVNGGAPAFPGGVDAGFVFGVGGDALFNPVWMP